MVKNIKTTHGIVTAKIVPQSMGSIDTILESYIQKLKLEYINGIKLALQNPSIGELLVVQCIDILNRMQNRYWGGASDIILSEDPTQFGLPEQHQKIRSEILKNLQIAASSVSPEGDIDLVILSNEFIGTGSSSSTEGLPWLHYFLEGSLDTNLVWINPDIYSKLNPDSGGVNLGRFGVGHMWHISNIEGFNSILKSSGVDTNIYNYDSLKHPQSGQPGQQWFSNVVRKSTIVERVRDFALNYASNRVK